MMPLRAPEPSANACRYAGRPGHVESYFLRANDPARPRALWLKATLLAPDVGEPVAESWLIWFDGEKHRRLAHRATEPLRPAQFAADGEAHRIRANGCDFALAASGSAQGALQTREGEVRFDLRFESERSHVAAPLSIYPLRVLREGSFPKSKLLTPFPYLRFSGELRLPEETISLSGWHGMQGHNWGREHAFEYAWGQCLFPASQGAPAAMVEGFSGRVRIGGRTSPRISALVVRRGERTLRFDRLFDLWNQGAELEGDLWRLRMRGADGEARLTMSSAGRPSVCLGYRNPDGQLRYCINSKLAEVRLQVQPSRGAAFECHSAHGGALEFLRAEPDARFPHVV